MLLSTEGIEPHRARKDGSHAPLYMDACCCLPEGPPGRRAHAVECGWDRSESGQREQADPREHRLVQGAPRDRPPPADAPGTGHHHGGQVGQRAGGHCPRTGPHGHRVPPPRARRRRRRAAE